MPTNTNSLESTHGHSNVTPPRRNSFWGSMHRIVEMMLTKSTQLSSRVRCDFNDEIRLSFKRSERLDTEVMAQERHCYNTTVTSCDCGETAHLSGAYGSRMPCSHQYSLGAEKPSEPDTFNISFPVTWPKCVLDIRKVGRGIPEQLPARISYAF
jgi:hypothetical protein